MNTSNTVFLSFQVLFCFCKILTTRIIAKRFRCIDENVLHRQQRYFEGEMVVLREYSNDLRLYFAGLSSLTLAKRKCIFLRI